MTNKIQLVAAGASGLAALLWAKAALIWVPDNKETFVGELQRAGRWNAAAALFACIAFLCQAYLLAKTR